MVKRTFGWVQNPGDLKKLKRVVGIFVNNSFANIWLKKERLPLLLQYNLITNENYSLFLRETSHENIEITYNILKGKGAGKTGRKNTICSGLIQAVLDGQQDKTYTDNMGGSIKIKKPYVDDWSADGYLRWAVSCGLLNYNKDKDTCKISELGIKLIKSEDNSVEEKEILSVALLSYPPVTRILNLLKTKDEQTKFELGSQLGIKGELGFTSITQSAYLCDYCEAKTKTEQKKVKNNMEGDSDKYARGIASWLNQMNWVKKKNKEVVDTYKGKQYKALLQTFSITRNGEKALIKARGNSRNPKIKKIVLFEMLASNKAIGSNCLRYERAYILKILSKSERTLTQLKELLKSYNINISEITIKDHINGLVSIGINIVMIEDKYKLLDKLKGLEIPDKSLCKKDTVIELKERIRNRLNTLDHKYLVLVDLAYSDVPKSKKNIDAREFEIQTADLFVNELGFNGKRLGDTNRPDIIISHGTQGTIIDNKSYKNGFNIDQHCRDEMARYVNENQQRIPGIPNNEWWKEFSDTISTYTFLFITSYLKGRFIEQLEYISNTHNRIQGGAINIENLLYVAESIKSGNKTKKSFFDDFNNNEIVCMID